MADKQRRCKCGCGKVITGHPNKKFFNRKHKDKYWNRVNPRGIALHCSTYIYGPFENSVNAHLVGQKIDPIEDSMHPHDPHCFGD